MLLAVQRRRDHREQVAASVPYRLNARDDREQPSQLMARDGVGHVAEHFFPKARQHFAAQLLLVGQQSQCNTLIGKQARRQHGDQLAVPSRVAEGIDDLVRAVRQRFARERT